MKIFITILEFIAFCIFLPNISIAIPVSYSAISVNIDGKQIKGTVVLSDNVYIVQNTARFDVLGFSFDNNGYAFSGTGGHFEAPIVSGIDMVFSTFGIVIFAGSSGSWSFSNGFSYMIGGESLSLMSLSQYASIPPTIKLSPSSSESTLNTGPYGSMVLERVPLETTPVPEPSTALLLGAGVISFAWGATRRKKKHNIQR